MKKQAVTCFYVMYITYFRGVFILNM